jgi:hypothetical protein
MPPANAIATADTTNGSSHSSISFMRSTWAADGSVQLWGNQVLSERLGGVVVFGNKTAFHRTCLDVIRQSQSEPQASTY